MVVKKDVDFFEEGISLPSSMTPNVSVAKLQQHLASVPQAEVQETFKTIKRKFFAWTDTAGGTAGDVPQAMKRIDPLRRATEAADYSVVKRTLLDGYHDMIQAFEGPPGPGTMQEQQEALARMEALLLRGQKVKPEDIAAAVGPGAKPGSAVFDFYCDDALFPSHGQYYAGFCH
jgi:hypothetical protein